MAKSLKERIQEAVESRVIVKPVDYDDGEPVAVSFARSYWDEMRWDANGRAWGRSGRGSTKRPGRWLRRRDRDFGTPVGDLIIDPWIQNCLKDSQSKGKRKP